MLTLALTAALLGAPQVASKADTTYLQASHVHTPDGVLEDAVVVIKGGKIEGVGTAAAIPAGATVLRLEGHLTPGLVALSDQSGLPGNESKDTTRMVMDRADLAHAFVADHSDYDRLVHEGVTSVVLTPPSGSLCGGRTALVKPGGALVVPRAHLHLSFSSAMFTNGRKPTSYAGAIAMLEEAMTDPSGGFGLLKGGKVTALLEARTRAEVGRAAAWARRHQLSGMVYGCVRAGDVARALKDSGLGVALPPWSAGSSERVQASARALAAAGVPFGFALDAPAQHPASLRMAGAACVRAGLDSDAALRALTADAAALAGAAGRVGVIAAGADADLVLWSGAPLDLTSAVHRVWIGGDEVHHNPAQDKKDEESK